MKFTLPSKSASDMLQTISSLRGTREYRLASIAVMGQFVIGTMFILWYWRFLPPQVPLWYSQPWGEERLTSPFFLFLPLLSAAFFYIINIITVSRHVQDHPIFARVLFLTSALVSFLSVIIVVRIVTLIS